MENTVGKIHCNSMISQCIDLSLEFHLRGTSMHPDPGHHPVPPLPFLGKLQQCRCQESGSMAPPHHISHSTDWQRPCTSLWLQMMQLASCVDRTWVCLEAEGGVFAGYILMAKSIRLSWWSSKEGWDVVTWGKRLLPVSLQDCNPNHRIAWGHHQP